MKFIIILPKPRTMAWMYSKKIMYIRNIPEKKIYTCYFFRHATEKKYTKKKLIICLQFKHNLQTSTNYIFYTFILDWTIISWALNILTLNHIFFSFFKNKNIIQGGSKKQNQGLTSSISISVTRSFFEAPLNLAR